jgi:hypothetical protein
MSTKKERSKRAAKDVHSTVYDGVQCPKCSELIVSLGRHDFHWCGCGSTAIDGGLDYTRILAEKVDEVKTFKVRLSKGYKT